MVAHSIFTWCLRLEYLIDDWPFKFYDMVVPSMFIICSIIKCVFSRQTTAEMNVIKSIQKKKKILHDSSWKEVTIQRTRSKIDVSFAELHILTLLSDMKQHIIWVSGKDQIEPKRSLNLDLITEKLQLHTTKYCRQFFSVIMYLKWLIYFYPFYV